MSFDNARRRQEAQLRFRELHGLEAERALRRLDRRSVRSDDADDASDAATSPLPSTPRRFSAIVAE